MSYLIDSDWVADYLKGRTEAIQLLTSLFPSGLAISVITFGEVYEGIYYGPNPKEHELVFRNFLRGVRLVGINRSTARHFARIRGDIRERHGTPRVEDRALDLLIAATAVSYNFALVTRNSRHYKDIADLTIY